MKKYLIKLTYLLLAAALFSCTNYRVGHRTAPKSIIKSFIIETGINAISATDTALLNAVKSWQGKGDYPSIDNWTTVKIPDNFDLYGGLPGQSEYYSIDQTVVAADTIKAPYWKSLQVKAHPQFGYRTMVGVFDIKDSIIVAIAKTLANPQYGDGGAWQIYVEDYNDALMVIDTIYLK